MGLLSYFTKKMDLSKGKGTFSSAKMYNYLIKGSKGFLALPFVYPKIQKENEEKGARELFLEKRRSQRLGLLVELLHFISYLEKNKGSGLKRI